MSSCPCEGEEEGEAGMSRTQGPGAGMGGSGVVQRRPVEAGVVKPVVLPVTAGLFFWERAAAVFYVQTILVSLKHVLLMPLGVWFMSMSSREGVRQTVPTH